MVVLAADVPVQVWSEIVGLMPPAFGLCLLVVLEAATSGHSRYGSIS